jgi:uncharacterized Zn finger protein
MSWFQYESAHERREQMEREFKKRTARGEVFEPLQIPEGKRKITRTFWGNAWCQHIESYRDYENRLPRARSYLRQGSVFNLTVEPGKIRAQVAGSTLYDVEITIKPMPEDAWRGILQACAGQVGSLLDLLSGQLGSGVMEVIADKERGLFPSPREIRFNCNCPDYASLCKHSGAVLYGVGVKFDADPALFFLLRGVDPAELLSAGVDQTLAPAAQSALEGEDLSALFGIDFAGEPAAEPAASEASLQKPPKPATVRRVASKTSAKGSPPRKATATKAARTKAVPKEPSGKKRPTPPPTAARKPRARKSPKNTV